VIQTSRKSISVFAEEHSSHAVTATQISERAIHNLNPHLPDNQEAHRMLSEPITVETLEHLAAFPAFAIGARGVPTKMKPKRDLIRAFFRRLFRAKQCRLGVVVGADKNNNDFTSQAVIEGVGFEGCGIGIDVRTATCSRFSSLSFQGHDWSPGPPEAPNLG
jgi:hypothetical protein